MEILILAIVVVLTMAAGFVLALRSVERTVSSIVAHLGNTVGGKPVELLQREVALREKQADVEQRKAELEIKIREIGFEQEQKLANLRLNRLMSDMGGDVEA